MPSSRPKFFRTLQITAYVSAISAGAACSPDAVGTATPGPTGDALETAVAEQFGGVARPLLSRASGFTPSVSGDRFVGPMPTDWKKGLFTELPKNAASAIRFQAPDGFTLEVWDDARRGEAKETAHTVSYARDQGTAIWKAGDGYAEQWLYLPNGSAVRDVASYRWKGGEARQHGRSVDIYDDAGKARITVSAPEALTVEGEHLNVAMELRGERLWVVLDKAVEAPLLVDPVWVAAGDMGVPRMDPRTVLLNDGRVLAAGGLTGPGGSELASAELFDPLTDTWSMGSLMAVGRQSHTLTLLSDGRVLVVGGEWPPSVTSEIYDPTNNGWTGAALPNHYRVGHTATLLLDGRVLVAGGSINAPKSTELYDAAVDTWTATGSMAEARIDHHTLRLLSGEVLATGGSGDTSAEAYSPPTGTWTPRASGTFGHDYTDALLLADGTVMFPGGALSSTLERYDPVTDSWMVLAPTSVVRRHCPAVRTADDQILTMGGQPDPSTNLVDKSTEVFDLTTGTWMTGPDLLHPRAKHRANVLNDKRVIVIGGDDIGSALNSCEILLPVLVPNGGECAKDNECASAHCADGMCCDALCTTPCFSCKVAEGAAQDGICGPITGFGCDDGDLCTTGDVCAAGVCLATPTICSDQGECRIPYCDAATGDCLATNKPPGTPCGVSGVCDNYGDCFEPPGTGGAGGMEQGTTAVSGTGGFGGGGKGGAGGRGGGFVTGGGEFSGPGGTGEVTGGGGASNSTPARYPGQSGCSCGSAHGGNGLDKMTLWSALAVVAGLRRWRRADFSRKVHLTRRSAGWIYRQDAEDHAQAK